MNQFEQLMELCRQCSERVQRWPEWKKEISRRAFSRESLEPELRWVCHTDRLDSRVQYLTGAMPNL